MHVGHSRHPCLNPHLCLPHKSALDSFPPFAGESMTEVDETRERERARERERVSVCEREKDDVSDLRHTAQLLPNAADGHVVHVGDAVLARHGNLLAVRVPLDGVQTLLPARPQRQRQVQPQRVAQPRRLPLNCAIPRSKVPPSFCDTSCSSHFQMLQPLVGKTASKHRRVTAPSTHSPQASSPALMFGWWRGEQLSRGKIRRVPWGGKGAGRGGAGASRTLPWSWRLRGEVPT